MIKNTTAKYLLFGVLTTIVNILAYSFLVINLKSDYKLATVIAWILSVLFAFFTNKVFVFNSKGLSLNLVFKEMFSFFSFRVFSLFIDIAIMFLLIQVFHTNQIIAKIIANIFVVIINYFTSKYITFGRNNSI